MNYLCFFNNADGYRKGIKSPGSYLTSIDLLVKNEQKKYGYFLSSVADSESGAFLTPGSGIRIREGEKSRSGMYIPDHISQFFGVK